MSLQELNENLISRDPSEAKVTPHQEVKKKHFLKLFGKTFTIFAWVFSIVVLLNLEPVTTTIDTLTRLDSFLRYIRGEDKEFEKDLDHKYINLKKSFSTIKTSSFKSFDVIKEKLHTPIEITQGCLDAICQFLESIGGLLQTYAPPEEINSAKNEP